MKILQEIRRYELHVCLTDCERHRPIHKMHRWILVKLCVIVDYGLMAFWRTGKIFCLSYS